MKKLLLAISIGAAAAGVGYWYQNQDPKSAETDLLLSQVPADTLALSYLTQPIDHYDYANAFGYTRQQPMADLFVGQQLTPGQEFLINFIDAYMSASTSPESLKSFLGTGDLVNPVLYTVGMVPVYKLPLENPAAFWQTVDKQEALSNVKHEMVKLESVEYRRYTLIESTSDATDPADAVDVNETKEINLAVGVVDNVLTVTLDIPSLGAENPLKTAFGLTKPKMSILDTERLTELQDQYGEQNNAFMFVDFRQIVEGLTSSDGNRMARQMMTLDIASKLEKARAPECHNELSQIAANWPQMVAYSQYEVEKGEASMKGGVTFESNNQAILGALQSIRGVVSNSHTNNSMFGVSLGIDAVALASAVGEIWSDLTMPSYQCSFLAKAQQGLNQQNPSLAVSMGSGMVQGLKGVGIEMFGIDVDTSGPNGLELGQLDAIISVAADNPSKLLNMLQGLAPNLPQVTIKPDNKPVNIGEMLQAYTGKPMDIYLRLNNEHLALYHGENAEKVSEEVMKQPLTANGLMKFSLDTTRMLEVMESAAKITGEPVPEDILMSLQSQLVADFSFDVNAKGLQFDFSYQGSIQPPVKVAQQQ
ncbi:hypothetical protein BS333_14420 [Vibrio azureus]|uniref:Uncharacterized protein n=1 Tax=Vibrio azureus NBRC 104587 TaxID=1219077 RepID=U3ALC9_9VIBR|nr:hypothetical protein [Vibrio azureus]AUI87605.1 hypothetical protein BS333_14420 [Vibrio azureus]GAD74580.1 hypothetical protein VAZ01S_012_00610 [Vibrio azureus NBRC 104587]